MAEDPESEIELTEISAIEILNDIQEGKPVVRNHVRILGDLDLCELNLPHEHVSRTEFQIKILKLSDELKVVSSSIKITNSTINGKANFGNIIFKDLTDFAGTAFSSQAEFVGAIFCRNASFNEATFSHILSDFSGATFRSANFWNATFLGYANFRGTIFSCDAIFVGVTFRSASFREATFSRTASFAEANFLGDFLTFRNAEFNKPKSQEEAFRKAKNVLIKAGNRDEEEYHFYREMEAKRIQKGIRGNRGLGLRYWLRTDSWSILWKFFWYDIIERFFVQKVFGYGVHPRRVVISWFSIILLFAFAYWATDGMKGGFLGALNYIEGSFATAIAPGYIAVIINSTGRTPIYHAMAILETIIGTFLWAGFIATFAKRYMR